MGPCESVAGSAIRTPHAGWSSMRWPTCINATTSWRKQRACRAGIALGHCCARTQKLSPDADREARKAVRDCAGDACGSEQSARGSRLLSIAGRTAMDRRTDSRNGSTRILQARSVRIAPTRVRRWRAALPSIADQLRAGRRDGAAAALDHLPPAPDTMCAVSDCAIVLEAGAKNPAVMPSRCSSKGRFRGQDMKARN